MTRRLVVVYDAGAATPREIRDGLAPLGDLVFAVPPSPHARATTSLLREYADCVPVEAVPGLSPSAVLTFSERQLRLTASVTAWLGLAGHHPDTAVLLTDKYRQRQRLNAAGVGTAKTYLIRHPSDWAAAVRWAGLPAVLKPATGEGSRNTYRIDAADTGQHLVERVLANEASLVLEEYLPGRETGPLGDYVSVETVTVDDTSTHIAVTGKFPLLAPFREVGQYWPAHLSVGERDRVVDVASAAIRALDVRTGLTHTEIKLTPDGPRIIEVNGRLGGFLEELAQRAGGGRSLVRLAGQAALSDPVSATITEPDEVHFQSFTPAPPFPCTYESASGTREVRALPGVTRFRPLIRRGAYLDDGVGWQALSMLCGHAPDHAAMLARIDCAHDRVTYRFVTEHRTVELTGTQLNHRIARGPPTPGRQLSPI